MFLASDDARFITGQSLMVDGGTISKRYTGHKRLPPIHNETVC